MNVYKMNDCDSMAANHPAEALHAYAEAIGYDTLDACVCDGMIDNELTEQSLDGEMWTDWYDPQKYKTTFRAVIAEHIAREGNKPFFIASTEY